MHALKNDTQVYYWCLASKTIINENKCHNLLSALHIKILNVNHYKLEINKFK